MDYEKKYKEALERAKKFYNELAACRTKQKENAVSFTDEDERIRKELIEFIQWSEDRGTTRQDFHQAKRPATWIAYLEQQKDINCLACDEHLKGYIAGRNVTEEEKQKELPFVKDVVLGYPGLYFYDGERMHFRGPAMEENPYDFAMSQQEKQKEQKPAKCTPDSALQKIKRAIADYKKLSERYKDTEENLHQYYGGKAEGLQLSLNYLENEHELAELKPAGWSEDIIQKAIKEVGLTQHQINWFKTNVFPPKQEWSEEDEKMLNNIEYILHKDISYTPPTKPNSCTGFGNTYYTHQTEIDWLKSIRPKQEWSEEDIKKIRSEEYTKGFNDAAFGGKLKEWSVEDEDRIRQIERIAQAAGCTQKLQEEIHDWLKSLRSRPKSTDNWNPGEEQSEVKCEPSLPSNIDEAAEDHIRKVVDAAGHPGWDWETQDIAEAFKSGAEWQAERLLKGSPMPEDTVLFNKGVAVGYNQAVADIISVIESRIAEILGDAQPAPVLRAELRELIGRIKEE